MIQFPPEETPKRSRSVAISPCNPHSQLPPYLLCQTPDRQMFRRASHAGNLSTSDRQQQAVSPGAPAQNKSDLLNVPLSRCRGSSLPDNLSSCDLYKLRNFSIS